MHSVMGTHLALILTHLNFAMASSSVEFTSLFLDFGLHHMTVNEMLAMWQSKNLKGTCVVGCLLLQLCPCHEMNMLQLSHCFRVDERHLEQSHPSQLPVFQGEDMGTPHKKYYGNPKMGRWSRQQDPAVSIMDTGQTPAPQSLANDLGGVTSLPRASLS